MTTDYTPSETEVEAAARALLAAGNLGVWQHYVRDARAALVAAHAVAPEFEDDVAEGWEVEVLAKEFQGAVRDYIGGVSWDELGEVTKGEYRSRAAAYLLGPNAVAAPEPREDVAELPDVEVVAARVHEAWMDAKRAQGVTSRPSEWGEEQMVPYADLSDRAKDLDRSTVEAVYAAIHTTPAPESADEDRERIVAGLTAEAQAATTPAAAFHIAIRAAHQVRLDKAAPESASCPTCGHDIDTHGPALRMTVRVRACGAAGCLCWFVANTPVPAPESAGMVPAARLAEVWDRAHGDLCEYAAMPCLLHINPYLPTTTEGATS